MCLMSGPHSWYQAVNLRRARKTMRDKNFHTNGKSTTGEGQGKLHGAFCIILRSPCFAHNTGPPLLV